MYNQESDMDLESLRRWHTQRVLRKKYIILAADGITCAPNGEPVENMQVLGYSEGTDPQDALYDFARKNPWAGDLGFDDLYAQEVIGSVTPVSM